MSDEGVLVEKKSSFPCGWAIFAALVVMAVVAGSLYYAGFFESAATKELDANTPPVIIEGQQ